MEPGIFYVCFPSFLGRTRWFVVFYVHVRDYTPCTHECTIEIADVDFPGTMLLLFLKEAITNPYWFQPVGINVNLLLPRNSAPSVERCSNDTKQKHEVVWNINRTSLCLKACTGIQKLFHRRYTQIWLRWKLISNFPQFNAVFIIISNIACSRSLV